MIVFQPNCTVPIESLGYVSDANLRSTLGIVWSCVSVLVLCCWSILHLNVRIQSRPKTRKQKLRLKVSRLVQKLKWMLLTLLAPEMLLAKAVTDWRSARLHTHLFGEFRDEDDVVWTMAHSFLADMGGFAIKFAHRPVDVARDAGEVTEPPAPPPASASEPTQPSTVAIFHTKPSESTAPPAPDSARPNNTARSNPVILKWSPIKTAREQKPTDIGNTAYYKRDWNKQRSKYRSNINAASRLYGEVSWTPHELNSSQGSKILSNLQVDLSIERRMKIETGLAILHFEGDTWVLTAAQLYEARRRGLIARLPSLSEEDIADRDRGGDVLVKLLALFQVVWLVVQLAARTAAGFASSPLEVMTLSFAACAFPIYVLLVHHPQDVAAPLAVLPAARDADVDDMLAMAKLAPKPFWVASGPARAIGAATCAVPNNSIHHVWSLKGGSNNVSIGYFCCSGGAGAMLFGGVHLLAWDFAFPTSLELMLWRVAALVTMLTPIVLTIIEAIGNLSYMFFRKRVIHPLRDYWLLVLMWLGIVAFVLARLFLLVEAVRSLYFLPPSAYYDTWTSNVPHLG